MKKILALTALSLVLLACDDSSSSNSVPTGNNAIEGAWTTDTSLTIEGLEVPLVIDLDLSSNQNLTLSFDAGVTFGDGEATGTWEYRNDSLYLLPTQCTSSNTLTCSMFGGAATLPVLNLDENSWTTEYPLATGKITVQFDRISN